MSKNQEISKVIMNFGVSLLFNVALKYMHEYSNKYLVKHLILKGGGEPLNLHN